MTHKTAAPPDVVGRAPEIAGLKCQAVICEGFVCKGTIESTANVTFICCDGVWHRLVIDCGVVFWREQQDKPKPWAVPEEGWTYPHTDVGVIAAVAGEYLDDYAIRPLAAGAEVVLRFRNGRTITVVNENDGSNYRID